jgi:hypothetical protein
VIPRVQPTPKQSPAAAHDESPTHAVPPKQIAAPGQAGGSAQQAPPAPVVTGTAGKIIHSFSNGTGIQALAVRPNGQLLIAISDPPEIHLLDPTTPNSKPQLVHRFSAGSRIVTLAEYAPDRFAVLASSPNRSTESSASLWTVRLDQLSGASVARVAEIWEGTAFVSLAKFSGSDMFAAHSQGSVYLLNVATGALRGLFTDPTMETSIGGIRYKEPHVYFVNRDQGLFARIQVSAVGEAVAPVETIATGVVGVADLALAPWAEHVAYLVNYEQGQIQKVDENAKVTEAASGWPAPVVVQFGRGDDDRSLYVGTAGTLGMPGRVLAIPAAKA